MTRISSIYSNPYYLRENHKEYSDDEFKSQVQGLGKPRKIKSNYQEYATTKMIFGKYKGFFIKDIPEDYLKWAVMNIKDRGIATMFATELQRRNPKLR
jgi:hypothetical protein